MYPRWEHLRNVKGTCPICGKPAHVGISMRTSKPFWLHDKYDVHGYYHDHANQGLAPIELDEFDRLLDEAEAQGIDTSASAGGGYASSKRVLCVETGREFCSIQSAADSVKRSRVSLSTAIKRNGTCAGLHWEMI